MVDLAENCVIRFINISRKKEGIFVNFKVKGIRGGVVITASISVEIASVGVDPADPLEKIIEESSKMAVRELKKAEFTFEGLANI